MDHDGRHPQVHREAPVRRRQERNDQPGVDGDQSGVQSGGAGRQNHEQAPRPDASGEQRADRILRAAPVRIRAAASARGNPGPDHLRAYVTGRRIRSEVQPLEWRRVDFQAGTVRPDPGTTKNDEGRTFFFTEELRAVLEAQKESAARLKGRGIVCPLACHRHGKPIEEFSRSRKTACRLAGVPGRIPHDFRRSAMRNLIRAGISESVAMKMTGHKSRSVFERYSTVSEGDLREASRRLDRTWQAQSRARSASSTTEPAAKSLQTKRAPVAQLDRAAVS
ncbi:MAG: hypothetical protein FJW35_17685 [Acidobacteria bacterium]|nr:hypothetical protein [Acidobacteriota bacterium]